MATRDVSLLMWNTATRLMEADARRVGAPESCFETSGFRHFAAFVVVVVFFGSQGPAKASQAAYYKQKGGYFV